jgi:hypothetical protein
LNDFHRRPTEQRLQLLVPKRHDPNWHTGTTASCGLV